MRADSTPSAWQPMETAPKDGTPLTDFISAILERTRAMTPDQESRFLKTLKDMAYALRLAEEPMPEGWRVLGMPAPPKSES